MTEKVIVVNVPQFENLSVAKKFIEDVYLGLYRASGRLRESRADYLRTLGHLAKAAHFMIADGEAGAPLQFSHLRVGALTKQAYEQYGFVVHGLLLEAIAPEDVPDEEDSRLRVFFGQLFGIANFKWGNLTNSLLHRLFTALQRAMEQLSGEWAAKVTFYFRGVTIFTRCKVQVIEWEPKLFVHLPEYVTIALEPYRLSMAVALEPIF